MGKVSGQVVRNEVLNKDMLFKGKCDKQGVTLVKGSSVEAVYNFLIYVSEEPVNYSALSPAQIKTAIEEVFMRFGRSAANEDFLFDQVKQLLPRLSAKMHLAKCDRYMVCKHPTSKFGGVVYSQYEDLKEIVKQEESEKDCLI